MTSNQSKNCRSAQKGYLVFRRSFNRRILGETSKDMSGDQLCFNMEDLKTGTKLIATGVIVGAVGIGLYRAYQDYCCCENESDSSEDDLAIDLQSLVSDCDSQQSLASSTGKDKNELEVVEVPVDVRALATQNQRVTLQLKAINSPYQNATTQCCVRGQRKNNCLKQIHQKGNVEVHCCAAQVTTGNRNAGPSPRVDDVNTDENDLFETESIRRLDGAINEVNYMLQRLGSMLERTKIDFASRRTSVISRDYHGSERFINL